MIYTSAQYVHKAIEAATPWLVGTAAGLFVLWLIMLCYKAKPFAKELKWFFSLTPLHKFVVICTVSFFTLWGGSKERGILPSGLMDDISSTMTRVVETIQLRTLPENISSNAFAVTDFAVDSQDKATAFGVGWASNLFENVDSRNVDLFMSTNLAVNGWFLLGRYLMPTGTNSYEFTVSSNDVALAYRPLYADSFSRMAFFRFGLDFDSDGDGLTDAYENFVSFTDPSNPDTDGDGLSDSQELSASIATNPLLCDTDGDGVGDGDEIASGSNPHSSDTDGDGLSDVAEIGTMTAQTKEGFMWFDMSGGTDLLAGYSTRDTDSWIIPLSAETVINDACYTNVRVCVDGTAYLLCPTNSTSTDYDNFSSNLRYTWWSRTHLTIALCSSDLFARTSGWGSKILYGNVVSEGRTFDVVEYRNIGHWNYRETNELITCQLILPHDETNVIYVSYLCASNAFRAVNLVAGIQYGWLGSWKTGESYHNLSWPITPEFPNDGLTIKYSIGTATNPAQADTDADGLSDAEEILTYRTDPFVADMDGDALLDAEEFLAGTDPRNPDTDGDGMPDGWEVLNELDPLADDAHADSDLDGLLNVDEYRNATNPHQSDSDEDGLADIVEASVVSHPDDIPWFDMAGATVMSPVSDVNYALYSCEMPFTNRIAALEVSMAVVDVNGLVYFGNAATTNGLYSQDSGQDMSGNRSFPSIAVAPYWTDLKLRTSLGSTISHKRVAHSEQNYFVLQYGRIGTNSGSSNNEVSFQVSIPETSPSNVVYVKYGTLVDGRGDSNSYKVSVGAKSHGNFVKLPVSYVVPSMTSVTNGMVIAYHFGCGSSPIDADNDDDEVPDDLEMQHGTNPRNSDTDGDELTDAWEMANGLDPLSASGENGATGDYDGDFLPNAKEFEHGTNPTMPDTDGDALCDGMETGSIFVTNAVPWMTFDESEDITAALSSANRRCVNWPTPMAMAMQGETVTNVTVSANGLLFFNRAGHVNQGDSTSGESFRYEVDDDALVIAPYLEYTHFRTDIPGYETAVKVGTSTYNGEGYLLVEFDNAFRNTSTWQTNAVSFQVSVPTNHPTCAYVRYKDLSGQYMTGDYASIGMQTFDSRWLYSYCDDDAGKVWENLCLEFLFGANSNPLVSDTDQDGLSDGQEVSIGTSPAKADTDGDELPDNWEVQNSLDPLSAMGDDGASGDPDGDGVDNYAEYELGTNPHLADTDNDDLSDGKEAVCVSFANPLPWLEVSILTNMTEAITNASGRVVSWNLPSPILVQRETVTNITINTRGVVCLNRAGYSHPSSSHSPYNLETESVDTNAFVVVAYGGYLNLYDEDQASAVKIGTAEYDGTGYIVVEYDNMYQNRPSYTTNAISFQVVIPTGRVDRINVNYADVVGTYMDGWNAIIGCQSFGADDRVSYCRYEHGKIYDGMSMAFVVGYGSDPLVADTDNDGISDGVEVNTYGSNPESVDTDADGLADAQEATLGTALNNPDSDGDGLMDGWEVSNSFNPLSTPGNDESGVDTDGDGLTNLQEQSAGSNPRNADSDGDGLSDSAEFLTHHTNPLVADTDGDGMTDKQETDANYDPLDPDMDRDGMPDGWENAHGLAPQDSTGDDGADGDPDNDGLSNIDEYLNGTNPNLPDSDGDGVSDGVEVANGSDPNDASDGGQAPPVDKFREIEFNIFGDYAAWEMTIEGLGPDDTRIRKISMGRPSAANTTTLKMRKGNSYRLSMRWLNCDGHDDNMSPWYCWQALIDGLPRQASFDHNYSEGYCVRLPQHNNIVVGNGWIADNEDGLLTSHVHASQRNSHGGSGAGNVAQGLSATLYVLDDPMVVPDYDRNGKINDDDIAIAEAGNTTFRFWINDDNDSGDLNEGKKDCPGAGKNGQDKNVNGRSDLLDFTPVLLDVSKAFPPGTPDFIKKRVFWKLESSVVNAVWTSLSASDAGAFHKTDCGATFGPSLSQNAHEAIVSKLVGGKKLPDGFARIMQNAGDKGVVMIEGCASGSSLKLKGYMDEATTASVEGELKINISSVEDMYRWMNLRMVCGDASGRSSCLDEPTNRPDAECDGRHFVFVHGYNVNYRSARGWSAEMFKRLWQAGSQSMFTAVDWYGNESQIWAGVPFLGGESLDYYINVRHALDSAPNFSTAVNALPGDKVMLAHSLGNMLVSEAAKSYLLNYTKYYMLNAAVPIEAYDGTSMAREMIEHGWTDISPEKWAARWYENFHDPADFRRDLKWKGRFAGIHHAVNCYSLTEEVLNNATTNGWGGVWSVQELFKGTAALHLAPGNCEGGWGYNGEYTNLAGLLTDFAKTNVFSDTELIMSPIFRKFDNATLHQTNLISIAQTELNKVMGDGIPAVSFAAGANPIQNVLDGSIELSPDGLPYWPSKRIANQRRQWHHSDICNVAFFYVNFIFNKIVKGENQ